MQSILAVGHDADLLATRVAVLSRTKAEVVAARAQKALELLQTTRFDVVVLCHSLKRSESVEIAQLVHEKWADIPVLQVAKGTPWDASYRDFPIDAVSETDPKRLVDRVAKLLHAIDLPRPSGGRLIQFSPQDLPPSI